MGEAFGKSIEIGRIAQKCNKERREGTFTINGLFLCIIWWYCQKIVSLQR